MSVVDELFLILSTVLDDRTLVLTREIYDTISRIRSKKESKKRAACWAAYIASKKSGHAILIRDIGRTLGLTEKECVRASKEFAFSYYEDVDLFTDSATFMMAKWPLILDTDGRSISSLISVEDSLDQWSLIKNDPSLKKIREAQLAAAYTLYICKASMISVSPRIIQSAFCVGSDVDGAYSIITQLLTEQYSK